MSALLATEDLDVSLLRPNFVSRLLNPWPRKLFNILEGVTLFVLPGETLGLVGESGSGKTTLARTMLGLTRHSAGRITFEGREVRTPADFRALRRQSAMMFQDPTGSLSPRLRVGTLLAEPFTIRRMAVGDRSALVRSMLAQVGLPESVAQLYPHELSGGQARRVGVARALALRPRLLLADEPTAGLDVSVQGEVLNLIADLRREHGFAAIIITHNLSMIRHVSDRLAIMYLGRLVETGPTAEVFKRPLHPYTATLIRSEPVPDPRRKRTELAIRGEIPSIFSRPAGCEFHARCPFAQPRCRAEAPAYQAVAPGRNVRCHYPMEIEQQERDAAIPAPINRRGSSNEVEHRQA
ncbi:ABC transporter ATP-binding protein [Pseudaminobacter sp. 19-2017]|uniref:ABC transporter ATP-binding protein n=1 Tax=Pseudaminobacter soli (ex Zhang et al. 2022) TaxID=2831468 RepID=A0A942DZW3_9HYPH|nr:ABC transporter ATP-binding protein [Pseudaminobacter soli]MBS3650242.1 ABC transporter ATP-binding protein [Pseudaminobacter soli]